MWRLLRKTSTPALALPRLAKRMLALVVDASLCVLTVWIAFYLRLGDFIAISTQSYWAIDIASLIAVLVAIPIFMVSGLYRAIFRYSGWAAMYAVSRAVAVYGLVYAALIMAIGIQGIPRTVGIIQPLLLFFAIGGSRAFIRFWLGGLYQSQLQRAALPRALVYGAGRAGRQLVSALENSYEMRVVGFLDDDDRLHGHSLNGQPIFVPSDLPDLIQTNQVTHVLMAIPSASRQRRNQIIRELGTHQVAVRTLPSVSDLVEGRVTTSDLRDLDIEDLLGRDVIPPNQILLARNIHGKVVLITGAGGSIGSELARQVLHLRPRVLLIIDLNEFSLYQIHHELEALAQIAGGTEGVRLVPVLGSVQDKGRMREICETWSPDTVYHTAAYKHVPLVEYNVAEGLKNNVFGTLSLAQAAITAGVTDFVLISTDKAVRPTNVMGASKRLAEMCLQALFHHSGHAGVKPCKLSMVRFGNVLDSSGSVIPRFRRQIRNGGPITLTHPEITRFFMTMPEAAQLVIQAGAMAQGGDVFVLDMGDPVKISDLARHMVELSGLTVRDDDHPDGDIEICVTGLRPGEKLFEELLLGEDPQATQHPRIKRANDPFLPWDELSDHLSVLESLVDQNHVEAVVEQLRQLVSGYTPSGPLVDWVFSEQIQNPRS